VTGPFLSRNDKDQVMERANNLGVKSYEFFADMENLIAASDIVVCMGGYNTICEVLSSKTMSLVIPRETPRKEQYIRAKAFNHKNLIEFISWSQLNEFNLEEKILHMLENKAPFTKAAAKFEMTGIANICERVSKFWNGKNEKECAPDVMYGS
ncbi:MAG: glycosyltransferase, partial [Deltaproteobacteria bacterium]|nr:glycosyltransferase [Deltaproteobacteria bacterium]